MKMDGTDADLKAIFAAHKVQVYRGAEKDSVDLYSVAATSAHRLSIETLRPDLRYAPPSVGDSVYVESTHPDAIYRMRARVLGIDVGTHLNMMLEQAGCVERVQRRRKFRIKVSVPVRMDEIAPQDDTPAIHGVSQDVSTKGVRVLSPVLIVFGTPMRLTFGLGEQRQPFCKARVARAERDETGRFSLGFSFYHAEPGDSDRVRSVLTELLRRGARF